MQSYSIAEARDKFAAIVHEVENASSVKVTRRGKPIAMIISVEEYEQLKNGRKSFWEGVVEWRNSVDWDEFEDNEDIFADVRDRSPGREENPWLDS